ncbi:MAG: chloride channel protein [Anaerolineales bacterium]|nr:chloride channel protein [Anaerolineales bacterium]MCA9927652.1 chloride channel protein [Anaerolineales bacterium]
MTANVSHKGIGRKDTWLRRYMDQMQPPDSLVLVTAALFVGAGTGLGAVIFIWLLQKISALSLMVQDWIGPIVGLILFMAAAGLIVGFLIDRFASEAKGHGVPEVMEAIALHNGRIRPRVAAFKVLASSLTIGAGGSAGREGPIVQVGSALGSTLGQLLHFSAERVQTLVACGAAAGIAATFNAPIAGALFALEVILGKFTTRYFGAVVISSVTASIVGRAFLSDKPAFSVPAYSLSSLGELPIYIMLGVLSALVAVLFIRVLYGMEGFFDERPIPLMYKTTIGMILTAAVGLLLPERQALGPGLDFIGETIADNFALPLGLMAVLLLLKLLATTFTLGSGNSGGVFAPGLFMGAALGGMVGSVAHTLWPTVVVNPGAYAIVGMAAVFAGAARAPITGILIVFEMSNDYKLILPLMLATVISTLLAEHIFSESIYTLKLKLKGIALKRGRDLDLMQGLLVSEAMTHNAHVVLANMTLQQLGDYFQETHSHSFPVVDTEMQLVGMVSIRDYEKAVTRPDCNHLTVQDIATVGNLLTAYEDEPFSEALQRLAVRGVNKLPVLSRDKSDKVIGVIRRRDIIKAYNIALARQARAQFNSDKVRLRRVDHTEFMEIIIPPNGQAVGKTIADLAPNLPHNCVLVSVRRGGRVLIPHGDTVLQPADMVNVFVSEDDEVQVKDCLTKA